MYVDILNHTTITSVHIITESIKLSLSLSLFQTHIYTHTDTVCSKYIKVSNTSSVLYLF